MTEKINTRQARKELEDLVPHRAPMLLLESVLEVSAQHASATASISENHLFFIPGAGVPAWVGLEMMGQTAALMAGFQLQQGLIEAQTGYLLGSRQYQCSLPWFTAGQQLRVDCSEEAVVGDNLATFRCTISQQSDSAAANDSIASAVLSVFRQPAVPAQPTLDEPTA